MADPDVGFWCGVCEVRWAKDEMEAKLRIVARPEWMVVMRVKPIKDVIFANLVGSERAVMFHIRLELLKIVIIGAPYRTRTPFDTLYKAIHDDYRDCVDLILQFVMPRHP